MKSHVVIDNPVLRRLTTLVLLRRDDQILLAMKTSGFGTGKYNGVGGKVEPGETIEQGARRETLEEIGVVTNDLDRVAILDFSFPDAPDDQDWNQQMHVFLVRDWSGQPTELEKVRPQWFDIHKIPYEEMWPDDRYWLPAVIEGKRVRARFVFDKDGHLADIALRAGASLDLSSQSWDSLNI